MRHAGIGTILFLSSLFQIPLSHFTAAQETALLKATRAYKVDGSLIGEVGRTAQDVSGIACARFSVSTSPLLCLVINDQNKSAQLATIEDNVLTPGREVPLIVSSPKAAFGVPPEKHDCTGGTKKFKDLDGEGVAYSDSTFYVVGSHGCSRKDDEFRTSSFILSRIRLESEDDAFEIDHTYRLAEALASAELVGRYFAKPLAHGGVNIEGITVLGSNLLVGLRAPSLEGEAFIAIAKVADLFSPKQDGTPITSRVLRLRLGVDTGIRDLTNLPDGRILVLAGPTRDEANVPYGFYTIEVESGTVTPLGSLEDVPNGADRAKAEAVTVVGSEGNQVRLLVLFDGQPNGGPLEYTLSLR
jgi:hypothetical protein